MAKEFSMPTPSLGGVLVLSPFVLMLLGLAFVCVYFVLGAKSVGVDDESLVLSGSMYDAKVSRGDIDVSGIKVVNLDSDNAYNTSYKTDAFSLPGYKEGWFELENGEKAFLILTDTSKVAYIPAKEFSVLLSVADAPGLLAALGAAPAADN